MPNKTIYIAEDDLPLLDKVQELSGATLSSAIVQALRRYIELEEAKKRGFDEITVIVNTQGAHRRKRFLAYRLVRWLEPTANGKGTEVLNVYRTAGGRYALHRRVISDWDLAWGDPDVTRHPNRTGLGTGFLKYFERWGYDDWESFRDAGDYELDVYETMEDLKPHVSAELYRAIGKAMEGPDIEEIDI